jgi:long-chain fatty acid transport protein
MLVGDRASGLGGAYTAISDDPTGCFYNPAGIAFAPYNSLSASVNAFGTSRKIYKGALTDVNGNEVDWEQYSSDLLPNFFGIVKKLGPGMFGLSYAVPDFVRRRQEQTFNDIDIAPGNPTETYTINVNDDDKTYLFGPSYAYSFSDSLSFGATLYVYYRDTQVIRNELLLFQGGEHYFINRYETKTDWGFKPILGAIWEPLDKLAIGLSLSKIYVTSSEGKRQTISRDTTEVPPPSTDDISLERLTSSEKEKFPLTISFGVTYFASPKLLLSGDIRYYQEVSGGTRYNEQLPDKEAIYNLSLGAEYYFTDSLAVRAGLFTDKANTSELVSGGENQPEHIDIYGAALSGSLFRRTSSITLGMWYGRGEGEAQVDPNRASAIQDAEIRNFTAYVAASYRY